MAFTKEQAKAVSILDVAAALGMELKRSSSQEYYWTVHDSLKINTRKNRFSWYSRDIHGDVINLVEAIKGVSFKEAMHFLETGNFPEFVLDTTLKAPFEYRLGPYEEGFVAARDYLKNQRGLSDETIDFFEQQGVLAQARYRNQEDGHIEPVVVFKYLDQDKQLVGASLQGILPDQERHEGKGYLKKILYNSDGLAGLSVDVGQPNRLVFAEAPIDLMSYYELHKDNLQDVRLVAMEGLKEQTISRYFMELYSQLEGEETYRPDLSKVGTALEKAAKLTTFFDNPANARLLTLAVDNDKAGHDFIKKLTDKGIKLVADQPPLTQDDQKKTDWNDYLKQVRGPVLTDKNDYLDSKKTEGVKQANMRDETIKKSPENTQGITKDRTSGGEGVLQPEAEGSTKPAVIATTFEQTVTSHPTSSYHYLHFNTNYEPVQRRQSQYHPINPVDLKRMNQYAASIQKTAQWYLDELAGHRIHYFYSDKGETNLLTISFKQENFLHLTGIRPVVEGRQAADFVLDFAQGKGNYNQILVSNSLKEKLQVLPMLEDILDPNSFVLDNLEEVRIAQRLNFSEAIKSKDEDFLLLFKDIGDERVPASLMKVKGEIATDLNETEDKIILGVYRERDGQITQLSINENYIKDGGREMLAIMEANLKEARLNRYEAIEAERQLDFDGDGISNDDEIRLGTDPYNANSRPGKENEDRQGERIDMATVSTLIASNDTKGLSQHLRDGMRQYLDSDQYKTFLSAMSKFHNYSPQNIALLLAQNPKITAVASYQKWQKAFGRQVQKGEKGLKIRMPMTFTLKDENGQPKLDEQGKEVIVTRFKLGTVFDVSQTQGKPLPSPIYNLENDVLDYENLYRAARHVSEQNGVPISFEKIEDSKANGFFDPTNKRIVLADKQMSEAQIMKILFHEMAHSDLHRHAITESQSDYATGELQAESVAYVVANHYGIDTSDYSFAYLASWARNEQGFEQFEAKLKVVQEEAKSLIDRIDHALVLVKNKTITQDKFQAKLNQAQAKQDSLLLTKEGQEQDLKKSQDMTKNLS